MLVGSGSQILRLGKTTIGAKVGAKDGELWLVNSYIPEYTQASRFNHEPKRSGKLLVHRCEAQALCPPPSSAARTSGIPLKLYFNAKGRAKLENPRRQGQQLHDSRETEKNRDWARDKARLMR